MDFFPAAQPASESLGLKMMPMPLDGLERLDRRSSRRRKIFCNDVTVLVISHRELKSAVMAPTIGVCCQTPCRRKLQRILAALWMRCSAFVLPTSQRFVALPPTCLSSCPVAVRVRYW